jgi:hypothetical protein
MVLRAAITAGLVLASSSAWAASLYSYASVCRHPWDGDNHPHCETDAGTESAVIDDSFGTPGVTYSIHAVASAGASYGSVAVSGVYDALRATEDVFRRTFGSTDSYANPAAAEARFEDTWTVGGGLSGTGTISITFGVSGFYSSGCDLPCAADLPFLPATAAASFAGGSPNNIPPLYGMAGEQWNVDGALPPLSLGGTYTAGPIPITAGVPFPVRAAMQLFGVSPRLVDVPGNFNSSGVMDFANTAVLTDIEVRDAAGNPVPDFTLVTESGAIYGVPEPAEALLLAVGGAVLAAFRRRGASGAGPGGGGGVATAAGRGVTRPAARASWSRRRPARPRGSRAPSSPCPGTRSRRRAGRRR